METPAAVPVTPSSMRRPRQPSSSPPPPLLPASSSSSLLSASSPAPSRKPATTTTTVAFVVIGGICFQLGLMVGIGLGHQWGTATVVAPGSTTSHLLRPPRVVGTTSEGQKSPLHRDMLAQQPVKEYCLCQNETSGKPNHVTTAESLRPIVKDEKESAGLPQQESALPGESPLPLLTSSNLIAGAVHVKRNGFVSLIDTGVPIDPNDETKDDVLILYTSDSSLPSQEGRDDDNIHGTASSSTMSTAKAVENCVTMKVVYTEHDADSNCIAVVGHPEESYHVHRFHRVRATTNRENPMAIERFEVDPSKPLRQVPRIVETKGKIHEMLIPDPDELDQYYDELTRYLGGLEATLDALRPIARAVAASSRDGTSIVAMVVNQGQSELLMNFVCAAQSRNLDLSQVLVFATDDAAANLARALNVTVFDVRGAFGSIPTEASEVYGDEVFGKVVKAKIYCVHLLVRLGHNVLMQDVDVVWRRHPLEYFTPTRIGDADMVMSDDGNTQPRFAPFFANSGFYFVKSNIRTNYLYSTMIRMCDVVGLLWSDQETLSIFLSEHVSWRGLRVKVLGKNTDDGRLFPCGYHYHVETNYMRHLMNGTVNPYVFHMNWTPSKVEKLQYFSQMGEWHVRSTCSGGTNNSNASSVARGDADPVGSAIEQCCSATPVVNCYYRDLPSLEDCRDFPSHNGHDDEPPFWPEPHRSAASDA